MKEKLKVLLVSLFLISTPILILAQTPPHPNGGNAPTPGNNGPVGGGAPIDSGSELLLTAMAYGAYKLYHIHTKVSITD